MVTATRQSTSKQTWSVTVCTRPSVVEDPGWYFLDLPDQSPPLYDSVEDMYWDQTQEANSSYPLGDESWNLEIWV